jgi:hypothetical protein
VRITSATGETVGTIPLDSALDIEVTLDIDRPIGNLAAAIALRTEDDEIVLNSTDHDLGAPATAQWQIGRHVLRCRVPAHLLNARRYIVGVWAGEPCKATLLQVDRALCFDTVPMAGAEQHIQGSRPGVVAPLLSWRHEHVPAERRRVA